MEDLVTEKTSQWSASRISDQTYRTKFTDLPVIIQEWTAGHGGLSGKAVLDFGCGQGTTALGVCLQHEASRVVAIDISPSVAQCAANAASQLGLTALPPNFHLQQVVPGQLHDASDRFDVIYSWSVFEHVDLRLVPSTLELLGAALKPDGLLFIQISPLFYSPSGSHLLEWVPQPWGHLLDQHNVYMAKLSAGCRGGPAVRSLRSMFESLNRITATQLREHLEAAGFEILREHRTQSDLPIPARLLEVYSRDVLLTEQIVFLSRHRSTPRERSPRRSWWPPRWTSSAKRGDPTR